MSIPFWRNKTYTDDGCSIFQCLNCYNTWESRTSPENKMWKTGFKFCPCCGIEWDGEIETKDSPYEYYSKRQDIQECIDKNKSWWLLFIYDTEHDEYPRILFKVEAGGKYKSSAIRKWFLFKKNYHLNNSQMQCYKVELVFCKNIKEIEKKYYQQYILEEHEVDRYAKRYDERKI